MKLIPQIPKDFRDFAREPDGADVVEISMLLEDVFQDDFDSDICRSQLNALAQAFVERVANVDDEPTRFEHLGRYMGDEMRFRGDPASFSKPEGAFLQRALVRRRGLPITLSVLYMAVGRAAGITLDGVALPGRFLVGRFDLTPPLFLDPFRGGKPVTQQDCDRIVKLVSGGGVETAAPHLRPAPAKTIVSRMLRNLQMIYWDLEDDELGLLAARMLCVLNPNVGEPYRASAYFYDRMDETLQAIIDYEAYLRRESNAPDEERIQRRIQQLREILLNDDDR